MRYEMKAIKRTVPLLLASFLLPSSIFGQSRWVEVGCILSGHLLLSASYGHPIAHRQAIRYQFQLGLRYGKPVGLSVDWLYAGKKTQENRLYGGAGFQLLLAKDRRGWRTLPVLKGVLGWKYLLRGRSAGTVELWPAYFPRQRKWLPLMGLQLAYRRSLD